MHIQTKNPIIWVRQTKTGGTSLKAHLINCNKKWQDTDIDQIQQITENETFRQIPKKHYDSIKGYKLAKNKINIEYVKKWFKLSWLPIYPGIASLIFVLDVTVFAVITGSIEGVAFWAAAVAIAGLTIHARSISNAIYPKLLEGGKSEHVQENLSLLFYFAIPLVAISITFARPGLFALNPLYDVAFLVVIFLAIRAFLNNLSNLFISSLKGIEKVDVNENSTFIEYIKSKLFLVPTIQLIQYSLYIGSLIVVLLLSKHFSSQLELVIYWSVIGFATQLPFTLYFYKLGRKSFEIKVNHFNIFKYVIISVGVFGSTYLLMEEFLIYQESIFNFLPDVMLFMALSIGSYLVITYLVDSKTRKLFNAIIQEIKSKNTNS